MTQDDSLPPAPERGMIQTRKLRYKGGTLIAEDVKDLAKHRRLVCDPDGYRPSWCPRCGCPELDVHDYPTRTLRGAPGSPVVRLVRYICMQARCRATWRILPAFIARHLWRTWPVVEQTVSTQVTAQHATAVEPAQQGVRPVPRTTSRRWNARLGAAATQLVALLAASIGTVLEEIAKVVGLGATRREFVDVYALATRSGRGHRLADLAALVHRLERGIRLM